MSCGNLFAYCTFQSAPCTRVQGDDPTHRHHLINPCSFNPLPAPKYREISRSTPRFATILQFQSAPCTKVQGDPDRLCERFFRVVVSIRSLHQSTGRFSFTWDNEAYSGCFNPLPAPKYREISTRSMWTDSMMRFSIRSLAPKYREIFFSAKCKALTLQFQSAPCTKVQGDGFTMCPFKRDMGFQSAPCTRVQGDVVSARLEVCYLHARFVSIRSLHQSTGRSTAHKNRQQFNAYARVSIRSLPPEYREITVNIFPASTLFAIVVSIRSLATRVQGDCQLPITS